MALGIVCVLALAALWALVLSPDPAGSRRVAVGVETTALTPCGSGGEQIAFAFDAAAGTSYGRGRVRMWNCPNGDIYIKHGGTTRSPIIKEEAKKHNDELR